jgi:hypothetical protein
MARDVVQAIDRLRITGGGSLVLDSFVSYADADPGYAELWARFRVAVAEVAATWGEPTRYDRSPAAQGAEGAVPTGLPPWVRSCSPAEAAWWEVGDHAVVLMVLATLADTRFGNTHLSTVLTVHRRRQPGAP